MNQHDLNLLKLLEELEELPTPIIGGMIITKDGFVELDEKTIDFFKHFNIELSNKEPIKRIETLYEEFGINCMIITD